MPIIASARKRVRQTQTRRRRNLACKRDYKNLIKEYQSLITNKKYTEAGKLWPKVQKAIDLAAKKNILHRNNAARNKSRLSKLLPAQKTPISKTTKSK